MLGLARLAWTLAQKRAYPFASRVQSLEEFTPVTREWTQLDTEFFTCSSEYYRICDRMTRGEKP